MIVIQNEWIFDYLRFRYIGEEIDRLVQLLKEKETLVFPRLENGLFPAAHIKEEAYRYTGYGNVWVRDNIHIANAHFVNGEIETACRCVRTLAGFFRKHRWRFEAICDGRADPSNPMHRPHVRFNGETLEEISDKWAQAQNDALGYFLWFYSLLANENALQPTPEDWELLALMALYFDAVRYWQDEDSGHWEEVPRVAASSIGAVVRGLKEYRKLLEKSPAEAVTYKGRRVDAEHLAPLIRKGEDALLAILPAESIQPSKERPYDAALLFLIYPLGVVAEETADAILDNVFRHLQGPYGIRRYLGDSFWAGGYKQLPPEERTAYYGDEARLARRDRLLKPGEEAQWCIFDPVVSTIYGQRYQRRGKPQDLALQTHHLNRSLGQITGEGSEFGAFKCPELYYKRDGEYAPNDSTPLLWTQANLWVALKSIAASVKQIPVTR